jgi:single-strand DNA-binding protein
MMNIKNHVQLIGHLGANPEIKTLDNGGKMAKFSVAINETYNNKKGEKVTNTQWHNIVAWGGLATICERILQKGSHVTIEGKLLNRSFSDKEGNKRYITEIIANELLVINHGSKAA